MELVQTMLDMHRQLSSAGPEHERTLLAAASRLQTGRSTGRSAELYGLTERRSGWWRLGRSKYLYMQIDYNVVCC